MRPLTKTTLPSVCISLTLICAGFAQSDPDQVIFKAMNDELQRNVDRLTLEQYKPPFFVAYQMADVRILTIKATLGEIRRSEEDHVRPHSVRLMVGGYALNDENFVGGGQGFSSEFREGRRASLPVPLGNDYAGIRRAFWIQTDSMYKSALETYDQKLTALKQQNKSESERMDDYSRSAATHLLLAHLPLNFDKPRWEAAARDISVLFRSFDQIMSSTVYLLFMDAVVYLTSNEGTRVRFPVSLACLWVNVFTQAEDGEPLTDYLAYCAPTPQQLPALEQIKADAKGLAESMVALRKAPALADSYSGPVLFEGSAVAALLAERLFDQSGLIGFREPVYAVENPSRPAKRNRLESKVGQRICSNKLTIKAVPKMKSFNNVPLAGSFQVDAEGVVPKDELVLVEKGMLRTLLNDRVPTQHVKESNGHSRPAMLQNGYFTTLKAPGVIEASYADGHSLTALRKEFLAEAAADGLDSIYIVRKLQQPNSGMNREMLQAAAKAGALSQPIALYRLDVKTGEEQLTRSAVFSDFPVTAFKRVTWGCKDQAVHNIVLSAGAADLPVSFIVPQALVFDDVSLEKAELTKPKSRLVPNPVMAQR